MSKKERILQRMHGFVSLGKGKRSILSRQVQQKALEKQRMDYAKAKTQYALANAQLAKMQQHVDNLQAQMNSSRQNINSISEQIRNMDLTGANACRDRNGVTTYYINNKEHVVSPKEDSDSAWDLDITPFNEYKRIQKELKEQEIKEVDDESSTSDMSLADDDLAFANDIIGNSFRRL